MSHLLRLASIFAVLSLWGCTVSSGDPKAGEVPELGGSADGEETGPAACDFTEEAADKPVLAASIGGRISVLRGDGTLEQLHAFGPTIHGLPADQVSVLDLATAGDYIVAAAAWTADPDRMVELVLVHVEDGLVWRKLLSADEGQVSRVYVNDQGYAAAARGTSRFGGGDQQGLFFEPNGELSEATNAYPVGAPMLDGLTAVRSSNTGDIQFRKPNGTTLNPSLIPAEGSDVQMLDGRLVYIAKDQGAWVLVEDIASDFRTTGLTRDPAQLKLSQVQEAGWALFTAERGIGVAKINGDSGIEWRRLSYPEGLGAASAARLGAEGQMLVPLANDEGTAAYATTDGVTWTALSKPIEDGYNMTITGRAGTYLVRFNASASTWDPELHMLVTRPDDEATFELGQQAAANFAFDTLRDDLDRQLSKDGRCVAYVASEGGTVSLHTLHVLSGDDRAHTSAESAGNGGAEFATWLDR